MDGSWDAHLASPADFFAGADDVQELLDSDITEVLYTMGESGCNCSRSNVNISLFIDIGQAIEAIRCDLQTTTSTVGEFRDII